LSSATLTEAGTSDATPTPTLRDALPSLAGDTDANGVSVAYEVSTDGGTTSTATSASQSSLADGSYKFHAVVTDPAGNSSTTSPISVIVDNTTPSADTRTPAN